MRPGGSGRPARRRGSTLVELMVVVAVGGVLAAVAVPSFRKAIEQSRIDQASGTLRAIWAAQRFYHLDHSAYAPDLETLKTEGLIDEFNTASSFFTYSTSTSGGATAVHQAGTAWSGTLSIDSTGALSGEISDGTTTLTPPLQFLGG